MEIVAVLLRGGSDQGNGKDAMHTSTPALADSRRPHAGMLSAASLMHESDDRLVALARSGSERAWSEITRRYRRQLRSYCERFVGVSRAEDAVQQAFLQAFLALRDGAEREIALRAWLYRIAHNCSIDLLRKGTPDYDQLDIEYDGAAQPPTLFEQREDIRRLVARMRDLPDAQRQALALRELEGRSYEEISAQLGHTGSGVRQLIFRARTTLRNGVAGLMPFGLLKGKLSHPSAYDLHHVASAAAVPASSGNGVETVSAATLAVVAVLGGGFAVTDASSRRGKQAPAQTTGTVAPQSTTQAAAPPATGFARLPELRGTGGVRVRLTHRLPARAGTRPLDAPSLPVSAVMPVAPLSVVPAVLPAAPTQPPVVSPGVEPDGTLRESATPPAGADAEGAVAGSGAPASPVNAPAGASDAAAATPAPAAKPPKEPAVPSSAPKPQPPKSQPPKSQPPKAPAPVSKPALPRPDKSQPPKAVQPAKGPLQKKPGSRAPQPAAPKNERR